MSANRRKVGRSYQGEHRGDQIKVMTARLDATLVVSAIMRTVSRHDGGIE
jgi:hypothetical protein